MSESIEWLIFLVCLPLVPPLTIGIIRKIKARLQNRIGASIFQPFYNLHKLLEKGETISSTASWIFRGTAAINFGAVILIACLVPWLSFKPPVPGDDIFLIVYLLALIRFFTMLASLDSASPFGGFAASREATVSLLVEPAVVLSLVAIVVPAHTTSLSQAFAVTLSREALEIPLWLLAGAGLFLSSLAELSRMPVDDPTTHLELTMVHEAMVIENSGKNLALAEYTYAIRLAVLYGLSAQCFLNAVNLIWPMDDWLRAVLSLVGLVALAAATAVIEGTSVKLQWRRVPEFIAYGLTMSLLASLVAIARGLPL